MNKFGGGFGGNMQQLMKQAQQMQEQMKKAQEELAEVEVTGTSGSGLVSVVLTGKKEMVSAKIKKEAVDVDDLEMLEDLLVAAFNDALSQVEEISNKIMGPFAGTGLF